MRNMPHLGPKASPSATMRRLAERRVAMGMSQVELGDISGYCPTTISCWERGENMPKISAIEDLAEAMGMVVIMEERNQ